MWDVTSQMASLAPNELASFVISDVAEHGTGAEQSFFSREKGEQPSQLVVVIGPG